MVSSDSKQQLPIALFADEADQTEQRYIWANQKPLASVVWQELFGSLVPKNALIVDVSPKTGGKTNAALRDAYAYVSFERDESAHAVIGPSLVNGSRAPL